MYGRVQVCFSVCIYASTYVYLHVYLCVLVYFGVHWYISVCTGVFWCALVYFSVYWCIFVCVGAQLLLFTDLSLFLTCEAPNKRGHYQEAKPRTDSERW